jgi:hypothetical protein
MRKKAHKKGDNNSSIFSIFIPLYLVILAFFILLNTIAVIEHDKKKEALGSIKKTFSGHADIIDITSEIGIYDSAGKTIPARHYFQTIAAVAKDTLDLVEADIIETGNKMQLVIPINKIFTNGTYKISAEKRDFIVNISEALSETDKDERIEIELIFGINEASTSPNTRTDKNLYRAGILARTLISMGAKDKNIIIGAQNGPENILKMNFYKREIENYFNNLN